MDDLASFDAQALVDHCTWDGTAALIGELLREFVATGVAGDIRRQRRAIHPHAKAGELLVHPAHADRRL